MTTRYITPQHLVNRRFSEGKPMPEWDLAVICFRDVTGSRALLSAFGATPISYKVLWGYDPGSTMPVFQTRLGWARVGIVPFAMWGGTQAAILVEELAALGVKYVLGFGAAGSIDPALHQGTQIVVNSALPTDGTSRAYTHASVACDQRLRSLLPGVQAVTAATVDALYQESDTLIESLRRDGAQIINMESSPFYAAAKTCGVPALWIGNVSDELGAAWKDWHVDRAAMNEESIRHVASVIEGIPATFK